MTDDDNDYLAQVAANWEGTALDLAPRGDAGIVCIHRYMFTWAILSGLTVWGYENRWCYGSYEKAKAALDAWAGLEGTEPAGWHRHPSTGRRVDADGRQDVYL